MQASAPQPVPATPAQAVESMVARLGGADRQREDVGLEACAGRILGLTARMDRDSPAFDHSAMDGYAVRCADLAAAGSSPHDLRLEVVGESRIGRAPAALHPARASAVRVSTGSPIPAGADRVLKREDVIEHVGHAAISDGGVVSITVPGSLLGAPREGGWATHIRRRGENAAVGDTVLPDGTLLTAPAVGVLAGIGVRAANVYTRVKVAIIGTGDEVVQAGEEPGPFEIRDSNAAALGAAVRLRPWLQCELVEHVRDDADALRAAVRRAGERAECVILTGGVSMGHRDPVRPVLESLGVDIVFHRLPQRPGKPMLGAVWSVRGRTIPVFGLPGNPVSALITFTRIVLPVLGIRGGMTRVAPAASVELANPDGASLDLWWHRPVRIEADGRATLLGTRGSGDFISIGASDGFIEQPPGACLGGLYAFYNWH